MSIWLLLLACTGSPTPAPAGEGLVGDHVLNPFPVGALHMTDGHLDLPGEAYGLDDDLTPLRTERLAWRTGFSPAQTSVAVLPSVDVDALEDGVRMFDRTAGEWLPCLAEIDLHPAADGNTLLVRPLAALPYGHSIAVVVTTEVSPPVEHFHAMLSDGPPPDLEPHRDHFLDLVSDLAAQGLAEEEIAIAWDFPVEDGTRPLRVALETVAVPSSFSLEPARELDEGDPVAVHTFRATTGTFVSTDFLLDDTTLDLDVTGAPSPVGEIDVDLYVHIPESLADAPAGSAPVLVFGHGIFGTPEAYLEEVDDPSRVLALADELGAVVVGIRWRGLTRPDLVGALNAAADFARIHEITDRLVQGQANMAALMALLTEGDLLDDPVFHNRSGERLPAGDRIVYYGISLGAIEGAVMLAQDPPVDAAVLHVGGSAWSTMLERSSNWSIFEALVVPAVPDPVTRQRLYATSQLWWDPVDPISYTQDLQQRSFLLQEATGDQQVPNLTTRMLARSAGLSLLDPAVEPVDGLPLVNGPVPAGARTLVQMDPEVEPPAPGNRPAANNGSHETPRHWPGIASQTLEHLQLGTVGHYCGASACTASNQGE